MLKRLVFIALGLAIVAPAAQAQQKLTWRDCIKVFTWANAVEKSNILDGKLCGEAWHLSYARDREDEFLGYVFLSTVSVSGQDIHLVVGVSEIGEIAKVAVKETGIVEEEFLAQFKGKNEKSSFEIAQTGDDFRTIPAMVKEIRNKKELSVAIAKEVQAIINTATLSIGVTPTP